MMISRFRIWPIVWLVVALLSIIFSSFTGGNISEWVGWLLLFVWAPLGLTIPHFRIWPIVWLIIAFLISAFSFTGGDTSILTGWLFLVWTAPFGMIWDFFLYDYVLIVKWLPKPMVEVIGVLFSVFFAYVFWFILIPWIRRNYGNPMDKRNNGVRS
jgi:hypothetical protein